MYLSALAAAFAGTIAKHFFALLSQPVASSGSPVSNNVPNTNINHFRRLADSRWDG